MPCDRIMSPGNEKYRQLLIRRQEFIGCFLFGLLLIAIVALFAMDR